MNKFIYFVAEFKELLVPFTVAAFGILATAVLKPIFDRLEQRADNMLLRLNNERDELNQKIESKNEFDIFDTIRLNLNQLNEYYTINKAQARSSFLSSIVAIILGLFTIIIGIIIQYYSQGKNINLATLTSASGILLEFIGGAYFFMYKKSLEQVNFFFRELIKIQDTMLAINLVDTIDTKDKTIDLKEKIIISLLERSLK